MGRRLAEVYPTRTLALGGATMLGLFAIVAIALTGSESRDENLSLVAGVFAYSFILFAAIVAFLAWRGKKIRAAHQDAEAFIESHPVVTRALGEPVDVRLRPNRSQLSADGDQITVPALVEGPLGMGSASAVGARSGDEWSMVGGSLTLDDDSETHELPPS